MDIYTYVKILLIIACSYIFYLNTSCWQVKAFSKNVTGLIFIVLFSFIMNVLMSYIEEPFTTLTIILLSSIFLKIVTNDEGAFINIVVAFAASYLLFFATIPFNSIILVFIFKTEVLDYRSAIITCIVEIVFVGVLQKMKLNIRLPKNNFFNNILFVLALFIILIYSMFRLHWVQDESVVFVFLGFGLCAAALYFWFKSGHAIDFILNSKDVENKKLEVSIDKVQTENESLAEENDFLSEVLDELETERHRDNKLLPAYQEAIERAIRKNDKQELLKILFEIKAIRSEVSLEQSRNLQKNKTLPSTGIILLDGIFSNMLGIAAQKDIEFDLVVRGNMTGITDIITQLQLDTLVSDLIQNAINATEHCSYKKILVYFWISGGVYELRVEDSGIPFEIETFNLLGKQRATTHADTGGSGIGFMTTFETLHLCNASLIITEMPPKPYGHTKSIAVRFDGKARNIIRSYRAGPIMEECYDGSWIIEAYENTNDSIA